MNRREAMKNVALGAGVAGAAAVLPASAEGNGRYGEPVPPMPDPLPPEEERIFLERSPLLDLYNIATRAWHKQSDKAGLADRDFTGTVVVQEHAEVSPFEEAPGIEVTFYRQGVAPAMREGVRGVAVTGRKDPADGIYMPQTLVECQVWGI